MPCLKEFIDIAHNLKTGKKAQVETLHKFIFEKEGDRNNRQRLREFDGFTFNKNDEQFREKYEYVRTNLTEADLISVCIFLGLNVNAENIFEYIFDNLSNDSLMKDLQNDERDEDDDGSEGEGENENNEERNSNIQNSIYGDAASMMSTRQQPQRHFNERNHNRMEQKFSLNFRDVEESVRCFDGSGNIAIHLWVQEFEEFAVLMQWDDLQKMIFAKKSLKGLAKLFVQGEKGLTTWSKLRHALSDEFSTKINSAQVHKMLMERKMKNNESVQEYFYHMKDVAARGDIDDNSLIQYVIDGIRDNNTNKAILYGANTMREFKGKLRTYEMFAKTQTAIYQGSMTKRNNIKEERSTDRGKFSVAKNEEKRREIKCYNCGTNGHIATDCPSKHKGMKCFMCNKFGHVAKNCENKNLSIQSRNVQLVEAKKENMMMKPVKILDQDMTALLDTGSKVNVMKSKIYEKLNDAKLEKSNIILCGFGTQNNQTRPIGMLRLDVVVDDDSYNLVLHVVQDDLMDVDVVLGCPIFEQAEVIIGPNEVKMKKIETVKIMNINTHAEGDEIYDIEETASNDAKKCVRDLIQNYKPNNSKSTNVTMKIILTNEAPIASRPRRLPINERIIVEDQINEWLKDGIIENSESEFSSPILLVNKKDGGKRLCVDYRRINKVIIKDRFPLPLIEDQLDRLQDAKYFSTIDLKNGYFHVGVDEESRKYTAFVTHNGQYHFNKVPFGLSNSPAVFQRHINSIFRELTQRGVALPYVDDVIVPAETEKQAIERLKEVIRQCEDYNLKINLKKCHFLKTKIEFLGHIIENQTIAPALIKVKAMLKYPIPGNRKQLESFLGLASYFRKFIPNFAAIAKPLSDLKKKDIKFDIQEKEIHAINSLKKLLSEKPVLKIYNEKHDTELHTDASADGYGAVLLQRLPDDGFLHPIYYMSRKTTNAEQKYTSYELEILAVIEALKKFRIYLLGIPFKIITDCNAFAKTMEKRDLSTRVSRWILLLQEYNYTIEHRSGCQMRHVDALSRYPVMLIELQQNANYEDYFLKAGVLYKLVNDCEKIVVPELMQEEIIKKAHGKGHFALKKVKELLKNDYYIPKMEEKVQNCIMNCIPCLLNNRKQGKQEGELHPIMKPDVPLHTYHVDHLGPLESTHKNYKYIFAVMDAFTKFAWLYPTKSTTSSEVINKLKMQSTVFGNPVVIVSDRGTAFTSDDFENYCTEENIIHNKITTGLPRANGQVERLNSIIIAVLSKLSVEDPSKWYRHVDKVQQCINSSFQRSINTTPFEVLIGNKMRMRDDVQIKQLIEDEIILNYQENRDEIRKSAKQQIIKIQDENRHGYNLRRRAARVYKVGDVIAIKRTQFGGGLKLKPKYLGPYRIERLKGNDTYDVSKVGDCEGPGRTTTCAEYVKPWPDFGSKS